MAAVDRVVPTARPHLRTGLGTLALALAIGAGLPATAAPVQPVTPTGGARPAERDLRVINGRTFQLDDASQLETSARLVTRRGDRVSYADGWVFKSEVIVRAASKETVLDAMARFAIAHAGGGQVDFLRTLSDEHGYFMLGRYSVGEAVELADWLNASGLVERATVDHVPGRVGRSLPRVERPRSTDDLVTGANGAGVRAVGERDFRTTTPTDPLIVSGDFWHITNLATPANDHRIDEVHADGITGAGVTIGLIGDRAESLRRSFDPVHPDLVGSARPDLGQEIDPFFPASTSMTMAAGLLASTANSIGGAGVAFNSQIVPLRNGSIGEEFDAIRFNLDEIDIKLYSDYIFGIQSEVIDPGGFLFAAGAVFSTGSSLAQNRFFDPLPLIAIEDAARAGTIIVSDAGDDSLFPGFDAYFGPAHAVLRTDDDMTDTVTEEFGTWDGMTFTSGAPLVSMGGWTEYDGIVNNINVLTFAAVGEDGLRAPYSRMGPSIIASAYSVGGDPTTFDETLAAFPPRTPIPPYDATLVFGGGITPPFGTLDSGTNRLMTSTDISGTFDGDPLGVDPGDFVTGFGGTTAAAAVATGIVALMKQANPDLTLRDIKHIIQLTSVPTDFDPREVYWFNAGLPAFASTWQINAAFNLHSDAYGFGILDAKAAVDLARDWEGMPEQMIFDTGEVQLELEIPVAEYVEIAPQVGQLVPGDDADFEFCVRPNAVVEEITLEMDIEGSGRGDLLIWLRSPFNTVSVLAIPRYEFRDVETFEGDGASPQAYDDYVFRTYKHWGERSGGRWEINVQDFGASEVPESASMDDGGYLTILGSAGTRAATWGTRGFEAEDPLLSDLNTGEKTWTSFRMQIYGYLDGTAPFAGCPVGNQVCPGDLNSDFVVDVTDLIEFLALFDSGSLLADIDGDGQLTSADIFAFLAIWTPGFCNTGGGSTGNRPLPTSNPNPAVGPGFGTNG